MKDDRLMETERLFLRRWNEDDAREEDRPCKPDDERRLAAGENAEFERGEIIRWLGDRGTFLIVPFGPMRNVPCSISSII